MSRIVWFNGKLAPADACGITAFDRGLLLGDGVFETLRVYDGKPFGLTAHVQRLRRSAHLTGLPFPDDADFQAIIRDVLHANGLDAGDASVRVTLTAGPGGAGVSRRGAGPSTLLVTASPVAYDPRLYEEGVHVVTATRARRVPPEVLDPRVKSLNYLPHVLARAEAEERGAFDALVLTLDGRVAEATTANAFLVKDGTVATPALTAGILDGFTRDTVLSLAWETGVRIEERDVEPEEFADADEAFLTASVAEVLPVTRFEDAPVGDGEPGPVTRKLLDAYRAHARSAAAAGDSAPG